VEYNRGAAALMRRDVSHLEIQDAAKRVSGKPLVFRFYAVHTSAISSSCAYGFELPGMDCQEFAPYGPLRYKMMMRVPVEGNGLS
jgi:hypothetical protein